MYTEITFIIYLQCLTELLRIYTNKDETTQRLPKFFSGSLRDIFGVVCSFIRAQTT